VHCVSTLYYLLLVSNYYYWVATYFVVYFGKWCDHAWHLKLAIETKAILQHIDNAVCVCHGCGLCHTFSRCHVNVNCSWQLMGCHDTCNVYDRCSIETSTCALTNQTIEKSSIGVWYNHILLDWFFRANSINSKLIFLERFFTYG
jgi:hypothetical protein